MRLHRQRDIVAEFMANADIPQIVKDSWGLIERNADFGPTPEDVKHVLKHYYEVPEDLFDAEDIEYILSTAEDMVEPGGWVNDGIIKDAVEQCFEEEIEDYKKEHADE